MVVCNLIIILHLHYPQLLLKYFITDHINLILMTMSHFWCYIISFLHIYFQHSSCSHWVSNLVTIFIRYDAYIMDVYICMSYIYIAQDQQECWKTCVAIYAYDIIIYHFMATNFHSIGCYFHVSTGYLHLVVPRCPDLFVAPIPNPITLKPVIPFPRHPYPT